MQSGTPTTPTATNRQHTTRTFTRRDANDTFQANYRRAAEPEDGHGKAVVIDRDEPTQTTHIYRFNATERHAERKVRKKRPTHKYTDGRPHRLTDRGLYYGLSLTHERTVKTVYGSPVEATETVPDDVLRALINRGAFVVETAAETVEMEGRK